MSEPIVSVIMTVYNGEAYIKDSIESITNQTYKDFELIIVLDGCTDNTEQVVIDTLSDYCGDYHIIKETENRGCPAGRMIGIQAARGSLIAIQDADDVSYLDRIEKQVNFMEDNPSIFCVGGFLTKIDENGEEFGRMGYPPETHGDVIKMIRIKCRNPILDPTVVFRKKDFYEVGGYSLDKKIYTVPDFDLWLRAVLMDKQFYNIQEELSKYRVHNDSVTNSNNGMMQQHMIVWKRFMVEIFKRKRQNRGFSKP